MYTDPTDLELNVNKSKDKLREVKEKKENLIQEIEAIIAMLPPEEFEVEIVNVPVLDD